MRAAEVATVRRMLGRARLVTVTGLPGVGKTAVSLAAASTAASGFADGSLLPRLAYVLLARRGDDTRYLLLDTIRESGAEKLATRLRRSAPLSPGGPQARTWA